jgi:hypothetical protein
MYDLGSESSSVYFRESVKVNQARLKFVEPPTTAWVLSSNEFLSRSSTIQMYLFALACVVAQVGHEMIASFSADMIHSSRGWHM